MAGSLIFVVMIMIVHSVKSSVMMNLNETKIVKKGDEVELICTAESEALGCSFKSPIEHNYNMLR